MVENAGGVKFTWKWQENCFSAESFPKSKGEGNARLIGDIQQVDRNIVALQRLCPICGSFHFRTKFEVSLDLSGIQIGNFVCMHLSSAVFCDTKDVYKIEQADPNIFEGSTMLVDAVYVWGVNQTSNVQYSSRRQSSI